MRRTSTIPQEGDENFAKYNIFLSYKWNETKDDVWKTAEYLESLGRFNVWLDKQEMFANKLERMEEGIKKANVVVIFFSDDYQESVDCRTEAEAAYRHRKKKLFVKMKPNNFPLQLWFAPIIGNNIYLDFYQFANPEREIISHIDKLLVSDEAPVNNNYRIERSRDIPSIGSYIDRPDEELALQTACKDICDKTETGGVLVYGEVGVGKTMLIAKSVASNDDFLYKCGVSSVIWINVYHLSLDRLANKSSNSRFYETLADLVNIKYARDDAHDRLQDYFKSMKPNKVLLILDDLFYESIFRCAFNLGDNVRCIAVSRRRDVVGTSCDRFLSQAIEVQCLSTEAIFKMFHQCKDIRLSQEKISRLAELCSGLPLLASVIRAKLRRCATKRQAEAYAFKLEANFAQLISESWGENDKAQETISELLLCGFENEPEDFRRRYYSFLVFEEAVNVSLHDLTILWQCSTDNATEFSIEFFNMSLIRSNCGDNDSDFDIFTVHAFLYAAALEYATRLEKSINANSLDELRSVLLTSIKNKNGENVFHQAIEKRRSTLLEAVLKAMTNLPSLLFELCSQQSGANKQTPLHYLLCGSRNDIGTFDGKYCLDVAIRVCSMALENDQVHGMLVLAIEDAHGQTVLQLLLNTVKDGAKWYHNALHFETARNRATVMKILIENGADINVRDEHGRTPLMTAVLCNNIPALETLLSWHKDGCSVLETNATDNEGFTALMLAAGYSTTSIVKLLLEHNFDINYRSDKLNGNAVWVALVFSRVELAELLFENGGQVSESEFGIIYQRSKFQSKLNLEQLLTKYWNKLHTNPADIALSPVRTVSGLNSLLRHLLVTTAIDVNESELQIANEVIFEGKMGPLEEKLQSGQLSDEKKSFGMLMAAFFGNQEMLELLLQYGADINAFGNKPRHTPLIFAAGNHHVKAVEFLLSKGADVNGIGFFGHTAITEASLCGHEDVVKVLIDHNADITYKNRHGDTALTFACVSGSENIVRLLLAKGADVNNIDNDLRTPLILAAMNGHGTVVKVLLENNADVEARDMQDLTALMWAKSNGHESVVELLQSKTPSNR